MVLVKRNNNFTKAFQYYLSTKERGVHCAEEICTIITFFEETIFDYIADLNIDDYIGFEVRIHPDIIAKIDSTISIEYILVNDSSFIEYKKFIKYMDDRLVEIYNKDNNIYKFNSYRKMLLELIDFMKIFLSSK